ncbi:MAG: hypothetical protein FJX47_00515 [Alphaproteobacteria bacterium]|nr:hypothetical protein [Alphaproteobacteria bacterium]
MLQRQFVGLSGGWAVVQGLDDAVKCETLPEIIASAIEAAVTDPRSAFWRNVARKREKIVFLN